MRRNWIFLALLLSVGVNCGLLGMGIARHRMHAERERDRDERPPGRDGARLADRLELTGAARESFLSLQRELAERVHTGRRQIDESRLELRRELISSEPDRARVEELLSGILREQEALDRALVANVFAAREVLDGRAEREYLRFVERFGGAVAGPRPPGPPGPEGFGPRPRFGVRRERGATGSTRHDDPDGREAPKSPGDRP